MKLSGEVIEASSNGDHLVVRVRTRAKTDQEWHRDGTATLMLPDTATQRKAMYVGRLVHITVSPAK